MRPVLAEARYHLGGTCFAGRYRVHVRYALASGERQLQLSLCAIAPPVLGPDIFPGLIPSPLGLHGHLLMKESIEAYEKKNKQKFRLLWERASWES